VKIDDMIAIARTKKIKTKGGKLRINNPTKNLRV
jgi:hypothetical protein